MKDLKDKYYHDLTPEQQNKVLKKILNKKNPYSFINDATYEKVKQDNIKSFILNWLTVEQLLKS